MARTALFALREAAAFLHSQEKQPAEVPMYVQPYVCFNGRCEEALRFYEHAIGARVSFLFRFDEAPGPVVGRRCSRSPGFPFR